MTNGLPPRRLAAAVALAVCAVAAPGCCGRLDRSDSAPSMAFALSTIGDRTATDARNTAETFGGLWTAIGESWSGSGERIRNTCELYNGTR